MLTIFPVIFHLLCDVTKETESMDKSLMAEADGREDPFSQGKGRSPSLFAVEIMFQVDVALILFISLL